MKLAMRLLLLALGVGFSLGGPQHRPGHNSYLPSCESWTSNGFHHPGIYHDCKSLGRIQKNYQSGKWAYVAALESVVARANALSNDSWAMAGPFEEVNWAGGDGHNIPLQNDGKSAYMLTLGWYATGNTAWLERAKHVVLEWASTLRILNEQIQGGEGIAYITATAEILRATAKDSGWSRENTETYLTMIKSIAAPWTETQGLTRNDFFMNQGCYGNNGAMTLAVFSENWTLYEDMVHHATVGDNPDPTIDYALPIQVRKPYLFALLIDTCRSVTLLWLTPRCRSLVTPSTTAKSRKWAVMSNLPWARCEACVAWAARQQFRGASTFTNSIMSACSPGGNTGPPTIMAPRYRGSRSASGLPGRNGIMPRRRQAVAGTMSSTGNPWKLWVSATISTLSVDISFKCPKLHFT